MLENEWHEETHVLHNLHGMEPGGGQYCLLVQLHLQLCCQMGRLKKAESDGLSQCRKAQVFNGEYRKPTEASVITKT